jgi:Skp family chaperone for outer membrane proteins
MGRAIERAGGVAAVLLALSLSLASAQTFPTFDPKLPVASISQDRLFSESAFGRAALSDQAARAEALASENRRIEQELEAEELSLTELRKTTDPDEFRKMATAFDTKVNEIRAAQNAKLTELTTSLESARLDFFNRSLPVLLTLMEERGIQFILQEQAILLAAAQGDITDEAIARINLFFASQPPADKP